MKLEICKLDSNRNLTEKEINWFVSAIAEFPKIVDIDNPTKYKGRINNLSDAFAFFSLPPFKDGADYTRNYDFQESDLFEGNQLNKGNSNPAAIACCCRKDGLLDDYDHKFQLTPVAKEFLYNKKVFYDEFIFFILTKQWIRIDNEFKMPMLALLWECINDKSIPFLLEFNDSDLNNQAWTHYLFKKITGQTFNKATDSIVFTRQDILKNSLLIAGLLTLKNGTLYVPESAKQIWEIIYEAKDSILKPEDSSDAACYRYVGSLDFGLKDILLNNSLYKYAFIRRYPNLIRYFFNVEEIANVEAEGNFSLEQSNNETEHCRVSNQTIYYGVPGCGKSTAVKREIESLPENNVVRVVFHADYSNTDFVGQILPKVENREVSYQFQPSPFIMLLKEAYLHQGQNYALIIEEINRGNAPAIFGSLFQLLDRRTTNNSKDGFGKGWSDYSVNLPNVNAFFRILGNDLSQKPADSVVFRGKKFTEKDGIRFPDNLSIYATMNTSDQNVFTLDNAFQRRWKMTLIPNTLDSSDLQGEEKIAVEKQAALEIENANCTWEQFRSAMNEFIIEHSQFSSTEDKRLGGWFILPDEGNKISADSFANKVVKYLWDDAFKFGKEAFANPEKKTLEDIISDFKKANIGINVFHPDFLKILNSKKS